MNTYNTTSSPELISSLLSGGIGVIRTDTIYGIVAQANNEAAVNRVYQAKGRDETKSPIVLISSLDQLFDKPAPESIRLLEMFWPGKVSAILPAPRAPFWIKRGNESVAYRLPDDPELCALIDKTGPLIAPSANIQHQPPATSVAEANEYFGDKVDFYVDQGIVTDNTPSQIIRINRDGVMEKLR